MKEIFRLIKFWILAAFMIKLVEYMPEPAFWVQCTVLLGAPVLMVIVTIAMAFADAERELREESTSNVTNNYYIVADQRRSKQYVPDLNVIDVEGIEMK